MKELKDKKFNLFGKRYILKFVDTLDDDPCVEEGNVLYGITRHSFGEIKVSKSIKDKVRDDDELEITKLHELFHAILDAGAYHNLNDDEPLVEWLARCTWTLKKQGVI